MRGKPNKRSRAPVTRRVSSAGAREYREKSAILVAGVNAAMAARDDIKTLIGSNPLTIMYENHSNHTRFISNVLALNDLKLLRETLPWVYRAYSGRGFRHDYFPVVLEAWKKIIAETLSPKAAGEILPVYDLMLASHETNIEKSRSLLQGFASQTGAGPVQLRNRVLEMLLRGNSRGMIVLAREAVDSLDKLDAFYLQVLMPVMQEIGELWERGEISVAHEHLATAVVTQTMVSLYPMIAAVEPTKGPVLVATAPGELHEIGARMVADCLEKDGFDVIYLGANTPIGDLVRLLEERQPFLLCLSVCMPFHLAEAAQLVRGVRKRPLLKKMRILVGGRSFDLLTDPTRSLVADARAQDPAQAVEHANRWWKENDR